MVGRAGHLLSCRRSVAPQGCPHPSPVCKEGPWSLTLHLGAERVGSRRWETSLCPLASWDLTPQHFPEDKTVSGARWPGQAPGVKGVTALREVVRVEGTPCRLELTLGTYRWEKKPLLCHQPVLLGTVSCLPRRRTC